MYFPDVRTKKFIEIRMADSVPYPLNISGVALWKGLMYNEQNLEYLHNRFEYLTNDKVRRLKKDIIESGKNAKIGDNGIMEVCREIVYLAEKGLAKEEAKYLNPLKELLNKEMTFASLIKDRLHLGKDKALEKNILNSLF